MKYIETLSAKHMTMGFLEVLGQLTTVDINPTEAIRAYSNVMTEMNGQTWVAINNNVVIGTVSIHILPKFVHQCGLVGLIEDVVVAENSRKQGVGQMLMQRVMAYAAAQGCYKIILDCSLKNIPFYEQCGFHNHEYQMRIDLI